MMSMKPTIIDFGLSSFNTTKTSGLFMPEASVDVPNIYEGSSSHWMVNQIVIESVDSATITSWNIIFWKSTEDTTDYNNSCGGSAVPLVAEGDASQLTNDVFCATDLKLMVELTSGTLANGRTPLQLTAQIAPVGGTYTAGDNVNVRVWLTPLGY